METQILSGQSHKHQVVIYFGFYVQSPHGVVEFVDQVSSEIFDYEFDSPINTFLVEPVTHGLPSMDYLVGVVCVNLRVYSVRIRSVAAANSLVIRNKNK